MEKRRKPDIDTVREVLKEQEDRVSEEPPREEPPADDSSQDEQEDEAGS